MFDAAQWEQNMRAKRDAQLRSLFGHEACVSEVGAIPKLAQSSEGMPIYSNGKSFQVLDYLMEEDVCTLRAAAKGGYKGVVNTIGPSYWLSVNPDIHICHKCGLSAIMFSPQSGVCYCLQCLAAYSPINFRPLNCTLTMISLYKELPPDVGGDVFFLR